MTGIGSSVKRTPFSIVYGKWIEPGRLVQDADVDDLRVEDLLKPVADEVVHRLHVQVHRQAALDVVDQRELGVALTGLVDQARAFEGRGDVPPDELEELLVGLGVRRRPPGSSGRRSPRSVLPSDRKRDADPADRLLADHVDLAAGGKPSPVAGRHQHRTCRSEGCTRSNRAALPIPIGSHTWGSGLSVSTVSTK